MRRRLLALVLAAAFGPAACGGSGSAGTGAGGSNGPLLVLDIAKGKPTGAVLVVDAQGRQQSKVHLGDGAEPTAISSDERAVYQVGDNYVVIDATSAATPKTTKLRVPSGIDLVSLDPRHHSARYAVLGSADRKAAFLVDLTTGASTDLLAAVGTATKFASNAFLAPDESAVAVSDGTATWLVPTANPTGATEADKNGLTAGFTSDSKNVLVAEHPSRNVERLVAVPVKGGDGVELAKGDPTKTQFGALTAVSGDTVAFQDGSKVVAVKVSDPKTQTVLATGVKEVLLFVGRTGKKLLMGDRRNDSDNGRQWSVLDVGGGEPVRLASVDGLTLLSTPRACVLLQGADAAKGPFAIVDIDNAKAGPPLDLNGQGAAVPLRPAADGCTVAVSVADGGHDGLWVVQSAGQPAQVDTNSSALAAISPDGKLAYVTERDKNKNFSGFVLELASGKRTDAIGGLGAQWLAG